MKIVAAGRTTISASNPTASTMRIARVGPLSLVTGVYTVRDGTRMMSLRLSIAEPRAGARGDQIDRQQEREGRSENDRGNDGRARIVELFEAHDDEERRDLRDAGHIAGDEDHRAVLTERTGERE